MQLDILYALMGYIIIYWASIFAHLSRELKEIYFIHFLTGIRPSVNILHISLLQQHFTKAFLGKWSSVNLL